VQMNASGLSYATSYSTGASQMAIGWS